MHGTADDDDHARTALVREFLTSGLYLAIVLWATSLVLSSTDLPPKGVIVAEIFGVTVGLLLAHWLAFRLAGQLAEHGEWHPALAREGLAQLAGGLSAAVVAAVPFVFLEGPRALVLARWLLAALPALAGYAIARERGSRPFPAAMVALGVLAASFVVVAVKTALAY